MQLFDDGGAGCTGERGRRYDCGLLGGLVVAFTSPVAGLAPFSYVCGAIGVRSGVQR